MYRNKLSELYLPQENDVIVDLWVGSSEVAGLGAFLADMVSPTSAAAPDPLTISQQWDRFTSTEQLRGSSTPDAYDWELTPVDSGFAGNTTFSYSQGLCYQERTPVKGVMDQEAVPYHHTIILGASSAALNDNTATVAAKLAHWSPLVTGTGELVDWNAGAGANTGAGESADMGLCEHFQTNYIAPAMRNLQAAGKRIFIGGLYVSISGDSLSGYAPADAEAWCANMAMLRRSIETFVGFQGLPCVILGVAQVHEDVADEQDTVRAQQELYASVNSATTIYFDTRAYPTSDGVHFDGQSCIDIGTDVTMKRYASRMGLAQITKVF